MTTNETFFFRDPAQHEALRTVVSGADRAAPGCAKDEFLVGRLVLGQEAYSLAMMLLELGLPRLEYPDSGDRTIEPDGGRERAPEGICRSKSTAVCRPHYLVKYFTRIGLEWQLKDEVRRMVEFSTFDLRQSMAARGPFDVVFCRNVLIYFDVEVKRRILEEIHGTLYRGGYLLLGGSETTLNLTTCFERRVIGQSVLYQA